MSATELHADRLAGAEPPLVADEMEPLRPGTHRVRQRCTAVHMATRRGEARREACRRGSRRRGGGGRSVSAGASLPGEAADGPRSMVSASVRCSSYQTATQLKTPPLVAVIAIVPRTGPSAAAPASSDPLASTCSLAARAASSSACSLGANSSSPSV